MKAESPDPNVYTDTGGLKSASLLPLCTLSLLFALNADLCPPFFLILLLSFRVVVSSRLRLPVSRPVLLLLRCLLQEHFVLGKQQIIGDFTNGHETWEKKGVTGA